MASELIGTIKELNVKAGDTVKMVKCDQYPRDEGRLFEVGPSSVFPKGMSDGCTESFSLNNPHKFGVISRVGSGPVRTVTRKEIVPGVYGCMNVQAVDGGMVQVRMCNTGALTSWYTAADIRAAIATLTEIADALEEQA